MYVSKTKEFCDMMNFEFTYSQWVWRQDALWNVSYYAGGWETWVPLDVVAQSWNLKDSEKEAIKDCLHKLFSQIQILIHFNRFLFVKLLGLHNFFNWYWTFCRTS